MTQNDFSTIWLREIGLTQREHFKIFTRKPICDHKGQFGSVGLIDCRMTVEIMLYGFLISFAMLVIEKLYKEVECSRSSRVERS